MCTVSQFKIQNINENIGKDTYLSEFDSAIRFARRSQNYSLSEVVLLGSIKCYYTIMLWSKDFNTIRIARGKTNLMYKALDIIKRLHSDLNNKFTEVLLSNYKYAIQVIEDEDRVEELLSN